MLELALKSRELSLHSHNLVFVWGICPPCSILLQQDELVGCQQDELLMGKGKCAINLGILLVLDVTPEVVAWDDHVRNEENIDGIVDHCPMGNDLSVVCVELGLEQFYVSLDGRAVGR